MWGSFTDASVSSVKREQQRLRGSLTFLMADWCNIISAKPSWLVDAFVCRVKVWEKEPSVRKKRISFFAVIFTFSCLKIPNRQVKKNVFPLWLFAQKQKWIPRWKAFPFLKMAREESSTERYQHFKILFAHFIGLVWIEHLDPGTRALM